MSNLSRVYKDVFRFWDWTSNRLHCSKGTRIIMRWDPKVFDVMVIAQTYQVMHIQLIFKLSKWVLFVSIVYVDNYYVKRRFLRKDLVVHNAFMQDKPWVIIEDYKFALNLDDCCMGSLAPDFGMRDFKECMDDIQVFYVNSVGLHYTWNKKPKQGIGVLKKIVRILCNTSFTDQFPNSCAIFHAYRVSDIVLVSYHSRVILSLNLSHLSFQIFWFKSLSLKMLCSMVGASRLMEFISFVWPKA